MFAEPIASPQELIPTFAVGRFDPATWSWSLRDESPFVQSWGWFEDGTRAINSSQGCSSDLPNAEPGRCYANGGVFDFESESWHELPLQANGDVPSWGAIGASVARYSAVEIPTLESLDIDVLDFETGTRVRLPAMNQAEGVLRRVTAVGLDAFVFGGIRYENGRGTATADVWIWRTGREPSPVPTDDTDVQLHLGQNL